MSSITLSAPRNLWIWILSPRILPPLPLWCLTRTAWLHRIQPTALFCYDAVEIPSDGEARRRSGHGQVHSPEDGGVAVTWFTGWTESFTFSLDVIKSLVSYDLLTVSVPHGPNKSMEYTSETLPYNICSCHGIDEWRGISVARQTAPHAKMSTMADNGI